MTLQVGGRAPDFSLLSQDGVAVRLSDFCGKKSVVLYFYPKDETSICTKEACSFRDQYTVFQEAGAEVIGVSSDPPESHHNFAQHHRLPFLLLSDADGELRKQYGVPSTLGLIPGRVTFVIDKKGFVRQTFSSQFQAERHVKKALEILKKI